MASFSVYNMCLPGYPPFPWLAHSDADHMPSVSTHFCHVNFLTISEVSLAPEHGTIQVVEQKHTVLSPKRPSFCLGDIMDKVLLSRYVFSTRF